MSPDETNDQSEDSEEKAVEVPHTYKLKFPFKFGSDEITELVIMRRPNSKDIGHMGTKPTLEELTKIVQRITVQTPKLIEKVDAVDIIDLTEIVGNFLAGGRKTGEDA